DGRAILLGEQLTPDGHRVDIQLKGSGRTRFSRGGDGRAALGPMLREHLIGEAMHELGIPTTRSLAVATTGEAVRRETPLPGAILTRVASSHLRVGTFEYAGARQDPALLRALADYTIERHAPECADTETPHLGLLDRVIEGQAALIARWMLVGFVHGVMNTDNAALSGETIDYGPCAFLDTYDPNTVFSSIDHHGRYAYGQQPVIGQWNMARFAETLLPLIDPTPEVAVEHAQASIERFVDRYEHHWLAGMKAKLGWVTDEPDDAERIAHFLGILQERRGDFTNTFRALTAGTLDEQPAFAEWLTDWRQRIARQPIESAEVTALQERHNPAVIPRNHLVEAALDAAWQDGDLGPFEQLSDALRDPYDHRRERADVQRPAPADSPPYRTFGGT
ncbi:MAG: YdiU family protein, partial [Acidobacteriota bacterium]